MRFCTEEEYQTFMGQAPAFEQMLVDSGIHLTKLWFSVTQQEQRTRFAVRQIDPVRRWKLSPMDLESLDKWEDFYTRPPRRRCWRGPTPTGRCRTPPGSNDKKRARINAMRLFLTLVDYEGKDHDVVLVARFDALVQRARDAVGD